MVAVLFPRLAVCALTRCSVRERRCGSGPETGTMEAACPDCGIRSRRRHSHYERRLSDTAVGGEELLIHLRVNRFSCRNGTCARATLPSKCRQARSSRPCQTSFRRGGGSKSASAQRWRG
ncbi:transposase family protein [Microbispora sp. NPDC046973]|uniref:transposase family protein n=1 Tax=Microbispora sp. NPDC046973 TaxID=3155022 RepID=UPI0033F9432A